MKQGLSLRVSQHLALTPQLQQSIRLLQLSTLELDQEVEQMLGDNPFLEREADPPMPSEFDLSQADTPPYRDASETEASGPTDTTRDEEGSPAASDEEPNWDGDGSLPLAPDDSEWGGDAGAYARKSGDTDDADANELTGAALSLQSHLHAQALALRLSEEDRLALEFLIESLNDDGYLEDSLASLTQSLGASDTEQREQLLHHFTVALSLLQNMEPAGVGARDLAECLRLQLGAMLARQQMQPGSAAEVATTKTAVRICSQPLDLLARRDVRRLMQLCHSSEAAVRAAMALIARLEPKPGRRFAAVERNIVVPDVLVVKTGHGAHTRFRVQLNPEVMPRLRVVDVYANALKQQRGGGRGDSNYAALQQRVQEARWFIKNIQQRFDTILRVSTAIVERQKSFLMHGALAMRPLVLREIADELGLHESTISRVTSAKYMATPQGTFELKYFFGSGLGTDSGGQASSTAVRALIKQFIAAESPRRPLSDNQLSQMLKEQGIDCARRTVAKYREALRIATASLRKEL